MILDTGGLYAFLDQDDQDHDVVRSIIESDRGPFLMTPFVLAELDYLVQRRLGIPAEIEFLSDVDAGIYSVVPTTEDDLHRSIELVAQHGDLGLGITDASVAVLAARYRTVELLTLDERHFRTIRPLRGGDAFRLLPLDR